LLLVVVLVVLVVPVVPVVVVVPVVLVVVGLVVVLVNPHPCGTGAATGGSGNCFNRSDTMLDVSLSFSSDVIVHWFKQFGCWPASFPQLVWTATVFGSRMKFALANCGGKCPRSSKPNCAAGAANLCANLRPITGTT